MNSLLQDKTVFIVGGTHGIGYALARVLLPETASVLIQGKTYSDRLERFCSQGNAAGFICDLHNQKYLEVLCNYARLSDILCIAYGPFLQKPLDKTSILEWQQTVYANLTLPGIIVSAAVAGMKERKWGRILLFGGTETYILRGFKTNAVYGAAKMGIMSLIQSISMSYASYGITANAICPGFTDTELLTVKQRGQWAKKNPDGKLVSVEAITSAALFLLKNSTYNGVLMPVDKGWSSLL